MLLKLGIKNLKHNPVMNILIIIQMSLVLVITVSMISTVVSRFKFYMPLKEQLNSKGYFYNVSYGIDPETGNTLRTTDELSELIEGEAEITAVYHPWLAYNSPEENNSCVSYDDKFIEMYTPELESGSWFDLNNDGKDIVQVVVSENDWGINAGDKIKMYCFDNCINARVTGVLKKSTKVIGIQDENAGGNDCRGVFMTYSLETEEKPLFIFRQNELADKNITMQLSGAVFVTYPENTPDSIIENNNEIMNKINITLAVPLSEMKKNSLEYIFSQIHTLLPILICVLILTLVGAVSVSALSAKRQLKNYAVYYICGLRRKQCALVNMYSSIISVAVSFAISTGAVLIIKYTAVTGDTDIDIGVWQVLGCAVIMTVYLILSVILPLNIAGSSTPNQILKSN